MTLRIVPLLLTASVVLYACGPRPPASETQARKPGSAGQGLAASLDVRVGEAVAMALRVYHGGPRTVELNFPSGHTHDFVVMDSTGRQVWKWSKGRLFTQAMQNRLLRRDDTLSYRAEWDPGELHGTFLAVVSVKSDNHPLEQRLTFLVP
ncbi:MAG: BsuPI-related putative proteinase inhibitor [Gemmatimonadaceae bacterium]